MKTKIFSFVLCFLMIKANAQQIDSTTIEYSKQGNISAVSTSTSSNIPITNSAVFLHTLLANGNINISFLETNNQIDNLGIQHLKFDETYQGIKVLSGDYLVHGANSKIDFVNGNFVSVNLTTITPSLTESQALNNALGYIGATNYAWQNTNLEAQLKQSTANPNATYYPTGKLVVVPKHLFNSATDLLAFSFVIVTDVPNNEFSILIDAQTGSLINNLSMKCTSTVTGTAQTHYSGTQNILCEQVNATTFKTEATTSYGVKFYTKNINTGTSFSNTSSNWANGSWATWSQDVGAIDAHWSVEKTLDYFYSQHGRLSYNNTGSPVTALVHVAGNGGAWSHWSGTLYLGDGDGVSALQGGPLDHVAHEIAHGVCLSSANLVYSGESGGLNEAFSDIWASCVEYWGVQNFPSSKNNKQTWLFAEEMTGPTVPEHCERNLKEPKLGRWHPSPDCYGSTTWNNMVAGYYDVHFISGVANKWFYILTEGECKTNDLGNPYNVKGIGIDKAAKIVYRTETEYLKNFVYAQYQDARTASLKAAKDLYGLNSSEYIAVNDAWYAVGLGTNHIGAKFPSLTITSPSVQYCTNPQDVTLTATTNATNPSFNWATQTQSISNTNANTLVEPVTGIGSFPYTVTVTSQGGCQTTKTGTITVAACYPVCSTPNSSLPATLTSSPATGKIFSCTNITIPSGAVVTLSNSELVMEINSTITVQNGATLNINGCHLYGCGGMWKGIKVNAGGVINITTSAEKSSFIEDAEIAVNYDYTSSWTVMTDAYNNRHINKFIDINNTIFNRNNISIQITTNYNDYLDIPSSIFSISNNVFTSRNIPFSTLNWNSVEEIKMYNSNVTGSYTYPALPQTYNAPYIRDNYPDNNFGAYLKQTAFNATTLKKPDAAIILNNIHFNPTSDPIIIGNPTGTSTNYNNNLFDNMAIGIKANSSPIKVVNSVFQKAYINATTPLGYGIYALGTPMGYNLSVVTDNTSTQPNNAFWDMQYAIRTVESNDVNINNCQIISSQRLDQPSNKQGQWGIHIKASSYNNIAINNNYVMNIANGVYIDNISTKPTVTNSIDVSNNTFIDINQVAPCSNCYIGTAITIAGSKALAASKALPVSCNNNIITRAFNGIYVNGLVDKNLIANNNTIALKRKVTTGLAAAQFGIKYTGGNGINGSTTYPRSQVKNNNITGDYLGNQNTHNQTGIYIEKQNSVELSCNDVNNLVHGFRFFDKSIGVRFWDNWMHLGNQNGFTLDGKGEIGIIGLGPINTTDVWCRSNNHWDGTSSTWSNANKSRVLCTNNSDADKSKLYVNSTDEYNPDGACDGKFGGVSYQLNSSIITATPNPNKIGFCQRCYGGVASRMETQQEIVQMLEEIAADDPDAALTTDEADAIIANQQMLYEILQTNPDLLVNSTELQQFIIDNNYSSLDYNYLTNTALIEGNYSLVQVLLNTWQFNNRPDENSYRFYTWVYNLATQPEYQLPIDELLALASSCPYTNGKVVFAARNLYNSLTEQNLMFDDACNDVDFSAARRTPKVKVLNNTVQPVKVTIYPNPTTGYVYIDLPNTSTEKVCWQITVTDVQGKQLQSKQIKTKATKTFLELKGSKGLYFVKVLNCSTGNLTVQKLILQ